MNVILNFVIFILTFINIYSLFKYLTIEDEEEDTN